MFRLKYTGLLLGLIAFFAWGCQKETDVFDGPSLIDRFGPFVQVEDLAVSSNTVDFANGESVFFTARFNKRVNWVVTITGQKTGAVKKIEGFSQELDASNSTWNGGTTDLPFFGAETCEAVLTIPEEPSVSQALDVETQSLKPQNISLITDFESDPGGDIFFGNFEFELTAMAGVQDNMPAVHGDKYFFFEGNDNVVSNFFVGLIAINAAISGETYFPVPTTIGEELYFNTFLYGTGTEHTIAVIQFATDSNGNGVYDDGADKTFQVPGDFPMNFTGWRQISHAMTEAVDATNNPMTEGELSELIAVRVLLISNQTTQPNPSLDVSFGIDYLNFTQGGPLDIE